MEDDETSHESDQGLMTTAWKGSQVLITGAGGFIGSHLTEHLIDLGAEVSVFLRYNSAHNPGSLRFVHPQKLQGLRVVFGDLRDFEAVREACADAEIVFHLGALISIPYSYAHPREVIDTNVTGTLNVLLAAREWKVRRVILTSTSEVYGSAQYLPIDERHPINPQSPYAATKAASDFLGMSFQRSYSLPVTIVRPFNTYGPRQSARAIIPTIITQALTRDTISLGSLEPTRDFTFVEDTVRGFLLAAQAPVAVGSLVNFGSGVGISIGQLAKEIGRLLDRDIPIKSDNVRFRPAQSEVYQLFANNTYAKTLLNWSPTISLSDGLARTIAWIREHIDSFDPDRYRT